MRGGGCPKIDSRRPSYRPISALLLAVAILVAGSGLLATLLPVRAHLEGFSTLGIGILGGVYYFGFVVGCWFGPVVVSQIGHVRAFAAGAAIACASALIHALFVDIVAWWVIRTAAGASFALLYVVIESWLNQHAVNETRGRIIAVYAFINLAVIGVGQFMLTLYDPRGFPLFCVVAILFSLALVPISFSTSPSPPAVATRSVNLLRVFRTSPVGFLGCTTVGFVNATFWALGPVFAAESGFSVEGIGLFMMATSFSGAAALWPIGRFSDQIDRRLVILLISAFAALAALGLVVSARFAPDLRIPFAVLFAFFALPLWSVSAAHTNDRAPPGSFVEVSSGLLLTYGVGAIIGPVAAGWLMDLFGHETLFQFTMTFHAALVAFTLYRIRRRPRQTTHTAPLGSAPGVFELDQPNANP